MKYAIIIPDGCADEAQETLGREINPTVYPLNEFQSKLRGGHHFLTSVSKKPRILLIGDENVLARLVEKRPPP